MNDCEKFGNFGAFEKTNKNIIILEKILDEVEPYFQREYIYTKPFYSIDKTYYYNGYLSSKATLFSQTRVGDTFYYDKNCILKKIVNHDKKFGKVKPDDIIKIIDKLKIINLDTQIDWFKIEQIEKFDSFPLADLNINYTIEFVDNKYGKYWMITDKKTIYIDNYTEDKYTYYFVDGETGGLFTEEEWDARTKTKKSFWDRLFGK